MFGLIAALIFTVAFALSGTVIAWMLATYADKIVAALLFQPIPRAAPRVRTMEVRHGHRP